MSDELTAETRAQAMVSRWIGTYTTTNAGTVQHMMVEVETVAEIAAAIRAAERAQLDRDCAVLQEWAGHYPTDIFPEDGTSVDCQSAAFARHLCREIEKDLRAAYAERQKEGAE